MSEEKPKIKSITIGAKNIGAAESSMVSPALPLEVEQYIEYLEKENKKLRQQPRCPCGGELEGLGVDIRTKEEVWQCKKCKSQVTISKP